MTPEGTNWRYWIRWKNEDGEVFDNQFTRSHTLAEAGQYANHEELSADVTIVTW